MKLPIFTMMVGLPGSGKSTHARKLEVKTGALVVSTDMIRKELFDDENCQDYNDIVFEKAIERIRNELVAGRDVIFDATNLNSKRRQMFLENFKDIEMNTVCVIMATPFSDCCIRNELRERTVPYHVLDSMYRSWQTPYWYEGWDQIVIINPDEYKTNNIKEWLDEHMYFDQQAKKHSLSLAEHCIKASELIDTYAKDELYYATLLHDCGKPFTKSFVDRNGAESKYALYFQHQNCGAYDSLFFEYPANINVLDVSILISLHMMPYFLKKYEQVVPGSIEKYKELWGVELFNKVYELHKADKVAH